MIRRMAFVAALCVAGSACGPDNPRVELVTQFGRIVVEVDSARAPATAANFLRYVDEGRYADGSFYRVRAEEAELMRPSTAIVQGGLWRGDTTKLLPPIRFESTEKTGIEHETGVVSMARFGDVNSARGEFFIVVGEQPHLDWRGPDEAGYAAFGRVVEGMDLVRAMAALPAEDEQLARPIPFSAARADD